MKQSLAQRKPFDPDLALVADDEAQIANERAAVIIQAYTQVPCGKGICSPDLSDTGMRRRIFVC